ncbi:MAG: hypothetical protein BGO77_04545 [Caedibacter sp. 37-49]|nr:MAG: hypothetical protein BGO77_04545 [Caedibacter sp. 37-49]
MGKVSFYDVNYRNNLNPLYKDIRGDVWNNEDIGITSFFSINQINKFINWLDLKPGMLILDACCGNGQVIAYITQKTNTRSYGIDINKHSIESAELSAQQKKIPIKFLKMDLKEKLPFPDKSLDAILCIESIIHFIKDAFLS